MSVLVDGTNVQTQETARGDGSRDRERPAVVIRTQETSAPGSSSVKSQKITERSGLSFTREPWTGVCPRHGAACRTATSERVSSKHLALGELSLKTTQIELKGNSVPQKRFGGQCLNPSNILKSLAKWPNLGHCSGPCDYTEIKKLQPSIHTCFFYTYIPRIKFNL